MNSIQSFSVALGELAKQKLTANKKAGMYPFVHACSRFAMRLFLFADQPIDRYAEHIAQGDKLRVRNIPQLTL